MMGDVAKKATWPIKTWKKKHEKIKG